MPTEAQSRGIGMFADRGFTLEHDGAIEAEEEALKYGSQQSLV